CVSPGTDHQETLVTGEPREHGSKRELVLTHERFPRVEAARKHERGWGQIAGKLAKYLVEGHRPKPNDFRLAYEFAARLQRSMSSSPPLPAFATAGRSSAKRRSA